MNPILHAHILMLVVVVLDGFGEASGRISSGKHGHLVTTAVKALCAVDQTREP